MPSIDKFLSAAASFETLDLARVNIAGGGESPFYCAQMRSFWREEEDGDQVVKETFGLRALLLDADTRSISAGKPAKTQYDLLAPTLLRLYPRPRQFGAAGKGTPSRELFLWDPDTVIRGKLQESDAASDLIVAPFGPWSDADTQNIRIPHLRLVDGRAEVKLELKDPLAKFLDYNAKKKTLFGGLEIAVEPGDLLGATLVPQGIEFKAKLPDPTRDFPTGKPDSKIAGVFRLECDTSGEGPAYRLRLVDADTAIDATENRIAAALSGLGAASAPVAIRYDKRPRVPPLQWPLRLSKQKLSLTGVDDDFVMQIDRTAIDLRIRTEGLGAEERGLAIIFTTTVNWNRRKNQTVDLEVSAGTGKVDQDQVKISFTKKDNLWTTELSDITKRPFAIPLAPVAERLLPIYRAGGGVGEDVLYAPYVFVPIHEGWLQIALSRPAAIAKKLAAEDASPKHSSAMSGRLFASDQVTGRGVVLDDAYAINLMVSWRPQENGLTVSNVQFTAGETKGQLLGFLFAAETSPTAREALPTFRGGPAATRDLPLWFGAKPSPPYLEGTFEWKQVNNAFTASLQVDVVSNDTATLPKDAPTAMTWLPPAASPFLTNFPLTRSLPSAPEPSQSRGLLPRRIPSGTKVTLKSTTGMALPQLEVSATAWFQFFAEAEDRLLLPTLAGVEFRSSEKAPDKVDQAMLRFDLPILDELFAWSDPPKKAAPPIPSEPKHLPTALEPMRLAEIWNLNRNRMALTRTQMANATEWMTIGSSTSQPIIGLVEPYVWKPVIKFNSEQPDVWGSYHLDGTDYRLDTAAMGLGGNTPVSFTINDRAIASGGHDFEVAGNAVNLFRHKRHGADPDLLWDSRGFGMAPEAEGETRKAAYRGVKGDQIDEKQFALKTLNKIETIDLTGEERTWSFERPLGFFIRDLPLVNSAFNGDENPIEGAASVNGQAFDAKDFPSSLHEWRLFETLHEDPAKPKPHEIRWGPFSFKPLRLRKAAFDGDGKPANISVIGSLRFAPETSESDKESPYGPDDVYQRRDLFQLDLTRAAGRWSYAWFGKQVNAASKNSERLTFDERAPKVTFATPLKSIEKLRASDDISANVTVDIAAETAVFEMRLFGADHRLTLAISPQEDGFEATAKGSAGEEPAVTQVWFSPSDLKITIGRAKQTLSIDGHILVMPRTESGNAKVKPDAGTALVQIGEAGWRWLSATPDEKPRIEVDHTAGVFRWRTENPVTVSGKLPLELPQEKPLISTAMVFAAPARGQVAELSAFQMTSAWMRITVTDEAKPDYAIHHVLLDSVEGEREHTLDISWSKVVTSPVLWPIAQVFAEDGKPLPADWLAPAKADQDKRSRTIAIAGEPDARLSHTTTFHLRRHRIGADLLKIMSGATTVRAAIRLLAVADHILVSKVPVSRWTTLDHMVITTSDLMAKQVKQWAFAPRQKNDRYRAEANPDIKNNGIVPLDLAAAGFHDRLLAGQWWKGDDHRPIIIGGAVTQFASPKEDGRAYTAVIPWLDMPGAQKLHLESGIWRVAAADLWPATPMATGVMPAVVVGGDSDGSAIEAQFGSGRFAPGQAFADPEPQRIIPVEQAYFEKWKANAPQKMLPGDIASAPLFLRAMMAIDARRRLDTGEIPDTGFDWRATTLQAGRFLKMGKTTLGPALAAVRVSVRVDAAFAPRGDRREMTSASLVVLSRSRATRLADYRRINAKDAGDLADKGSRAELVRAAVDLDPAALFTMREAEGENRHFAVVWRAVPLSFGTLSKGTPLTAMENDIGPSAALGWPSGAAIKDLTSYAPALGGEVPVLSHEAGLAARFQMFGWPALASPAMTAKSAEQPEALYISFANHITYERGSAGKLAFDGPPARHLVPGIARRRAPLQELTNKTLEAILRPAAPAAKQTAPILPPAIERGTVGRRPGVLEASLASITLPSDARGFDPEHSRFGRPANSGPVAAHQLRNPRSPVLPRDELPVAAGKNEYIVAMERLTLGLRRRTYVSFADLSTADGRMPLFLTHAGSTDIARFETVKNGVRQHDRAIFSLPGQSLIGPDWLSSLELDLAVVSLSLDGATSSTPAGARGRLEIGAHAFPLHLASKLKADKDFPAPMPFLAFDLQNRDIRAQAPNPPEVREALRQATADTPIRLVLEITAPPSDDALARLPVGPRWSVVLPLMLAPGNRRVVAVRTKTIIFGDPAYDRQLASQTASRPVDVLGDSHVFLLSADRRIYDLGLTLYFAGGTIDRISGEFEGGPEFQLDMFRLPPQLPNGDQPPPERLIFANVPAQADGSYKAVAKTVTEISLRKLVFHTPPTGMSPLAGALKAGDRLQLTATPNAAKPDKVATVTVDIVAEPVIAPPPSVYSVLESAPDRKRAYVPLHAAGPLPQKIEFPRLLSDLAQEHVQRRALFVWSYAKAGAASENMQLDLVKFDRSGGAQLPEEPK